VPFPTSCSPQAWASATPVQLLRTLLRLDPWVPHGCVWLAPAMPAGFPDLTIDRLPLAGSRLRLRVEGGRLADVEGLPAEVELRRAPRPVASAVHEGGAAG
jgi:hypothetical protein